jgi:hypothetical protein
MFTKFLLTVAVIALIWFGFKFAQRVMDDRRRREEQAARGGAEPGPKPRFQPNPDGASVQDLVKCPTCSTYRSSRLGSCGRSECPY